MHTTQQKQDQGYTATTPPHTSITSLLAQILARYELQWQATKTMARLEMKLSLRCMGLIVAMGLCSLLLLGFTWLGVLGLIAYGLFWIGTPGWVLIIGFIVVHLLVLWWLAMTMKGLSNEIGFQRSMSALTHTFHPSAAEDPADASST